MKAKIKTDTEVIKEFKDLKELFNSSLFPKEECLGTEEWSETTLYIYPSVEIKVSIELNGKWVNPTTYEDSLHEDPYENDFYEDFTDALTEEEYQELFK